MGLFDCFRKKKAVLTEEQRKWNRMWELMANGQAAFPYAELMTYQGEVNNGGHSQYFFNVDETADLQKELSALDSILPELLKSNLHDAYEAYLTLIKKDEDDEDAEAILVQCDKVFLENEAEIDRALRVYASEMIL